MATDLDEPQTSNSAAPAMAMDVDSDVSSSDSDSELGETTRPQVEWLATGRAKRSTAGNRMQSMLANEERPDEDSDLELLFQEDEDDAGFTDKGDEDGSDAQMDSSDDEDENEAQADDLEGEKELERQAREKKAAVRKRKAQEAIPAKFRKKVRISQPPDTPTSGTAPQPKPRSKKKSERASWLPTLADMPTRASERKTTRLSKEQLHQQMVEREARRKKQLELMEKKAKKLEAMKKPPMTQAERLKEAEIVEKRNSKSLNRWEEAEKQREEERLAKLAALNNRRLEGPVVTFWTGIIDLSEVQLKHVGKMVSIEEKPKRKRPSTAVNTATASPKTETGPTVTAVGTPTSTTQDAPSISSALPSAPETPRDPEAPRAESVPATSLESTPAIPVSSAPAPEAPVQPSALPAKPSSPAQIPSPPTQPPAPPTQLSAPLQPSFPSEPSPVLQTAPPAAPVPDQSRSNPVAPQTSLTTSEPSKTAFATALKPLSIPAPSASLAPLVASPTVKTEPQSTKPVPLALRPDTGPRFMPPPNPHFMQPTQPSVLAPPAGMIKGSMPVLGYAATPVPRSASLSAPTPSKSPSPLSQSPAPTPTASTAPVNTKPSAAFPIPFQPPPQQPSPRHTTASFQPILSTTPLAKPSKKKQTNQAASKKATGKATALRKPPPPPEPPEPEPPLEGKVTRSCIILQDFDEEAIKKPEIQTQILFGRKMNKLAKPPHPPLCVITNHPARYRDPETGLPFYNIHAYNEIRRLTKGDFKWSKLLGTWVGNSTDAASGVPTRFVRPETEEERNERLERKEEEKKKAEEDKAQKLAEEDKKATGSSENGTPMLEPVSAVESAVALLPAVPAPLSASDTETLPAPVFKAAPAPFLPAGVPPIMPSPDEPESMMPSASGPAASAVPIPPPSTAVDTASEPEVAGQLQQSAPSPAALPDTSSQISG